jgi:hypothetical protein
MMHFGKRAASSIGDSKVGEHVKERVENPMAPKASSDQALCMVHVEVARPEVVMLWNSRAVMGM